MRRILLLGLLVTGGLLSRSPSNYASIIQKAEAHAAPAAQKILMTARHMVTSRRIVRGSCWDWLNAAFVEAGYPASRREVILRHPKHGPYASPRQIRPGDWLYYINHSYGDIEHSGLFVGWVDRRKRRGLILSYGGERRKEPGRYRVYDLSSVYHISRAR